MTVVVCYLKVYSFVFEKMDDYSGKLLMCFSGLDSPIKFSCWGFGAVLQSYIFHISLPVCRYYVVIVMKFGL